MTHSGGWSNSYRASLTGHFVAAKNRRDTFICRAILKWLYVPTQQEAHIIAEAIKERGLKIKKGKFVRSVELPQSSAQETNRFLVN